MKLLAATVTLLSLASCAPKHHPTAHSGVPPTEPPQVLGVQTWPSLPERTTTTTTAVVVPATAAPPVTAHVHEVEPLAASEPVPYSSIEQVIADAFARFGGGVVDQAISVARCESELKPTALNSSSGAAGLFQVMPLWAEDYQQVTGVPYYDGRFDAWANATFAAWLYGQSGWRHWSCQP